MRITRGNRESSRARILNWAWHGTVDDWRQLLIQPQSRRYSCMSLHRDRCIAAGHIGNRILSIHNKAAHDLLVFAVENHRSAFDRLTLKSHRSIDCRGTRPAARCAKREEDE